MLLIVQLTIKNIWGYLCFGIRWNCGGESIYSYHFCRFNHDLVWATDMGGVLRKPGSPNLNGKLPEKSTKRIH